MTKGKIAKSYVIAFSAATLAAIALSAALLMILNAGLVTMPPPPATKESRPVAGNPPAKAPQPAETDYSAITERNLFRAKLQVEIPKPKTEKEIEEETLTGALREMTLKGVWLGRQKDDTYAVIDKGGQKGVWTYQIGEVVERGLVLSEVKQNSILLEKADFRAGLKLFAKGFERVGGFQTPRQEVKPKETATLSQKEKVKPGTVDLTKDVRKEGGTVIISKVLSDRLKADNSVILSSIAVRASLDEKGKANGYRVVTVDKGSLAEKIGIMAGDVVQEVNGYKIGASGDMNAVYAKLKKESRFVIKVLRGGKTQDLNYEIR